MKTSEVTHNTQMDIQPGQAREQNAGGPIRAGWYKRLFAKFQGGSGEGIEAEIAPYKRALFEGLSGDVLEIGPGGGPNLRYYAPDVRWMGVEPNPYMHDYLRETAARQGMTVDIRLGTSEELPAADGSMDAVVSTHVLCSVHDVARTLAEIRRVLKPGGKFYFIEHVAAPRKTGLRRVQTFVRPVWQVLGDGCQPNRETWHTIEQAGFRQVQIDHFSLQILIAKPHIAGYAVK